jgi:DNA modification methylase
VLLPSESTPLQVEQWSVDRLIGYARNPRKNDAANVERMVAAIREFGFRIPIVAMSDGLIVDGHLRLAAAKSLGLATVPVALADDLSEAQVKAFRLLANRSATWAEWDTELLSLELLDLDGLNFDLQLTGFDTEEINFYTGTEADGAGPDPDDVPATPLHPVSVPGDVWILGGHRLVCGDSTDPAIVKLALGIITPTLMVTDPPNGIATDPADRGRAKLSSGKPLSSGKRRAVATSSDAGRTDWTAALRAFAGDVIYLWHAATNPAAAQAMLTACGFEIRSQIIWAKSKFVVSRGHYHNQSEPCFYAVRQAKTAHWTGDRKQSTLWQIDKLAANTSGVASEKPVECFRRPIENNSSPGQVVYDPFVGSGTCIIAAEMTQRLCVGIDKDPRFVDVAAKRWGIMTGQPAVHEATGKTFEEMVLERPFGEAAA